MKPQRRPKADIDGRSTQPILIKPHDPLNKKRAVQYQEQLNQLLAPLEVKAELFGSVELEIASKGEWEYAIYTPDKKWFPVLVCLINHFHSIHFLSEDLVVFTDVSDGTDVEVIPMRGEAAQRNQAIMAYWRGNPSALQEYEQGKRDHSFSQREYYRWKDETIAGIVETL